MNLEQWSNRKETVEFSQIESTAGQEGIDPVTVLAAQVIAVHSVIVFAVANHWFNSAAPFEQFFEFTTQLPLAGDEDFDIFGMMICSPIALIYEGLLRFDFGQLSTCASAGLSVAPS